MRYTTGELYARFFESRVLSQVEHLVLSGVYLGGVESKTLFESDRVKCLRMLTLGNTLNPKDTFLDYVGVLESEALHDLARLIIPARVASTELVNAFANSEFMPGLKTLRLSMAPDEPVDVSRVIEALEVHRGAGFAKVHWSEVLSSFDLWGRASERP